MVNVECVVIDCFLFANGPIQPQPCRRSRSAIRLLGFLAILKCTVAFPGGQAQYLRVLFADVGAIVVPDGLTDEQVLFLSVIFPTGYMAAENCDIRPGQTVAGFGCGPVGLFAIKSAFLLGAGRVIAIDTLPERLELARISGADILDSTDEDLQQKIVDMTDGAGPDAVIEVVGMESHEWEGHLKRCNPS